MKVCCLGCDWSVITGEAGRCVCHVCFHGDSFDPKFEHCDKKTNKKFLKQQEVDCDDGLSDESSCDESCELTALKRLL